MALPSKKSKLISLLTSRGVIVVEILLIAFFAVGITKEVFRRLALRKEINQLEQHIAELEAQNRSLGDYVASINTESFQEREARKRLNLQRPGESLLILPETRTLSVNSASDSPADSSTRSTSNINRWWKYFFSPNS
jgi:cell division protein FtsB